MKSKIHTIPDTQYAIRTFRQLNNKKGSKIKGKIPKSSMTFNENKPNFKNTKIGVSSFDTSKYEILSAWRGKKQTQYKANSNPICGMAKFALSSFMTSKYVKFKDLAPPGGVKIKPNSNPIQTQFKPNHQKTLFIKSLSLLSAIQGCAVDKPMRKTRSLRINSS